MGKTQFSKALETQANKTVTENGAPAYRSTGDACVDLFGTLGAMREMDTESILSKFFKAWGENREAAARMLFYFRDVRGGQGERRAFREILKALARNNPEFVKANIENIPFFGRYDDLFCLFGTPAEKTMRALVWSTLIKDKAIVDHGGVGGISLLAKWMPSVNASSAETRKLALKMAKDLGLELSEYRKMLSKLRAASDVVERKTSANNWREIEYKKVPAKAGLNYANAFSRHDADRYNLFLDGESVNIGGITPYDLVKKCRKSKTEVGKRIADKAWKELPNFLSEDENAICVVDTSGSMTVNDRQPLDVAIGLGLYCAERLPGEWNGKFITFSETPRLETVTGVTLDDKLRAMESAYWGMNTNIVKVFDLILETAMKYNIPKDDMPDRVFIISDMQFDAANRYSRGSSGAYTLMEHVRDDFKEAGYELPSIVYWNVNSTKAGMFQDKAHGVDCCFVSGYSPQLFKCVAEGTEFNPETGKKEVDPVAVMNAAIYNERYDVVTV